MKKQNNFLKNSKIYPLSSAGKLNTYALFVERCKNLLALKGYAGLIVPTGLITNYFMQDLFKYFVHKKAILSIFDFSNRK